MTPDSTQPFEMHMEEADTYALVRISGSAGMTEADTIRDALERLAEKQYPSVILDLSGMTFICSMGLGALITGHLKSRHHNGRIKLVGPQPPVRRLLETTRLNKLFPVYQSVQAARQD